METSQSNMLEKQPRNKLVAYAGIWLSLLSIICQLIAYRLVWPSAGEYGGPMGRMAYEIAAAMAVGIVVVISLVIFVLMMLLQVKWYVAQNLAFLNLAIAFLLSAL